MDKKLFEAKAQLYLALMDADPAEALKNEAYLTALMADPEIKAVMARAFNKE